VGYFWETETSISLQRESWFPVLVLEFADNGSLHGLLGSPRIRRLPFECRQRISLDILHGLHALHQCDIIWGDCKPANILMFSTGPSPYDLTAKLTDFGLALVCPQPQDKLLGGTPSWRDPIKAAGFEQLCASDVYSTGLVIGAIMCDGRQFDTYMNQDSAAKSNSSGRNERIECAKFNGKIVEHLLTAIEKVLRPSFQDQELPPALSSTLELEKVKSAIRMAMADREPLERIIQVLENGRRFLDQ
jgi:serine/threonine protein kinase